jgi:hypothetical protein
VDGLGKPQESKNERPVQLVLKKQIKINTNLEQNQKSINHQYEIALANAKRIKEEVGSSNSQDSKEESVTSIKKITSEDGDSQQPMIKKISDKSISCGGNITVNISANRKHNRNIKDIYSQGQWHIQSSGRPRIDSLGSANGIVISPQSFYTPNSICRPTKPGLNGS